MSCNDKILSPLENYFAYYREIPERTLNYVADYLCRERHRTLVKNIYGIHNQATAEGRDDHANAVVTMKSVYPLALDFAKARQRRFEREARVQRGEVGHREAAGERQRDLTSESRLLLECSQLCDLAIFGKASTELYEDARELETEMARAGLVGDPLLARSRMSAWRAARKKARQVKWVDGKPTVVSPGAIRITGGRTQQRRSRNNRRGKGSGGGGGGSSPKKNQGGKVCHKCGSDTHMSYNCTHAKPLPGSKWAKRPPGGGHKKRS